MSKCCFDTAVFVAYPEDSLNPVIISNSAHKVCVASKEYADTHNVVVRIYRYDISNCNSSLKPKHYGTCKKI